MVFVRWPCPPSSKALCASSFSLHSRPVCFPESSTVLVLSWPMSMPRSRSRLQPWQAWAWQPLFGKCSYVSTSYHPHPVRTCATLAQACTLPPPAPPTSGPRVQYMARHLCSPALKKAAPWMGRLRPCRLPAALSPLCPLLFTQVGMAGKAEAALLACTAWI